MQNAMLNSQVIMIKLKNDIPSTIRQKGECQNDYYKKTKHAKFSEKGTFVTPLYAHTHVCVSGGKKCLFLREFGVLCFLVTLF